MDQIKKMMKIKMKMKRMTKIRIKMKIQTKVVLAKKAVKKTSQNRMMIVNKFPNLYPHSNLLVKNSFLKTY